MTDREFLKLNTSIQTASNAGTIHEEPDGTIPATIELRLPDNIFDSQSGNKKIDSVSMLTTKLRLSLLETPIAQIPLDTDLSTKNKANISTCKVGVYPWVIDDNGNVLPQPSPGQTDISFPNYKKHEITFSFRVCTAITPIEQYTFLDDVVFCICNDLNNGFPKTSRFYDLMEKNNLLGNHLLNMTIPSTHETLKIDNNSVLVKNVSTLEQMWGDAIENAITYASIATNQKIIITLIDVNLINSSLNPTPSRDPTIHIDELNLDVCYWSNEITDNIPIEQITQLSYACKPNISFYEDTMSLSYDTVAFNTIVPVFWSNSFIDTYEHAEQQLLDNYRKEILNIPPPKRVYKYGVKVSDDNETNIDYNFSLINPITAKVFNIVANKSTVDIFPFLPWIPISSSFLEKYNTHMQQMLYKSYNEIETITAGTKTTWTEYSNTSEHAPYGPTDELTLYYEEFDATKTYQYSAGWDASENPITIPTYLADHLQQNWPIGTPPNLGKMVLCIDFYFPELDPGYQVNRKISTTNPENRKFQMLIVPYCTSGYTPNPPAHQNYPTSDFNYPKTREEVNTTTTQIPPASVSYTTNVLPVKHELINTETNEINNKQLISSRPQEESYPFWSFYSRYNQFVPGLPNKGTYITQRFNHDFNTIFTNELTKTFGRHLPPWEPDDEILSSESRIINGQNHLRGSLIWIIYNPGPDDRELTQPYQMSFTFQRSRENVYEEIVGNETINTYDNIEENEVITSSMIYPNILENKDETFYFLNGASANLSIGNQEVIDKNDELFYITETTTTSVFERTKLTKFLGNYITDNHEMYKRYNYRTQVDVDDHSKYEMKLRFLQGISDPSVISNPELLYDFIGDTIIEDQPPEIIMETTTRWAPINSETNTTDYYSSDLKYLDSIGVTLEDDKEIIEDVSAEYIESPYGMFDEVYYYVYNEENNVYVWERGQPFYGAIRIPTSLPYKVERVQENELYDQVTYYYKLYPGINTKRITPFQGTYLARELQQHKTNTHIETIPSLETHQFEGNIRLTYQWKNIPTVILSPIQSFVLILNGMNVSQEIHPVNIAQPGSSSLTSTIPIIENYYSLATTLRDLHDELVIVKDSYADSAFYKLDTTSGQQRTITLTVKYITKDGRLHQLYIPKNGVFALQLTFGISFYLA